MWSQTTVIMSRVARQCEHVDILRRGEGRGEEGRREKKRGGGEKRRGEEGRGEKRRRGRRQCNMVVQWKLC